MNEYMVAIECGNVKQVFYVRCDSAKEAEQLVREVENLENGQYVVGKVKGNTGLNLQLRAPQKWI